MTRRRIQVHGIVQGVGFRPWVHQLAHAHGLAGFVLNSPSGVTIEIEGLDHLQQLFLEELRSRPPALAVIDEILDLVIPALGEKDFVIRESEQRSKGFALVPPDIATCAECMADFRDPANRRFGYPFTNCTNCGPRYTIIEDIPYDRRFTTMAEFAMCADCEAEYHDPANRRFHAQPNACPACGPWVELWDHQKKLGERNEAIRATQSLLEQGHILAIKGLGGFHLACDASNDAAVRLLRERKRRSDKPFALMAADVATAREFCSLATADQDALLSLRRPIVLMRRASNPNVSPHVAPGLHWLGVMLPYTPLHHLLFDGASFRALVMTSGNLSEEPIASLNQEIAPRLHPLADFVLLHNRTIHTRVDDSVVRVFGGKERVLRRSRGYAPVPIDLGAPVAQVLACGGELKNVFCLTKEHYAILSQHIGDLENLETMQAFEQTLADMTRFFRVTPQAVAHDLHPQYLSTRYALALEGVEKIGVQHHYAHIASCMADNRLDSPVIGVAFDGTGYGTDGKIWGGEILVCDFTGFERAAHFRYTALAGGDTAVRQGWRSALAYLRDAGLDPFPVLRGVPARSLEVVDKMIAGGINTVDCCSCGRLFDAVAAILGVRLESNYEGQAAMQLEAIAERTEEAYPFDMDGDEIDFRPLIQALTKDAGQPAFAAGRFHSTLANATVAACDQQRTKTGLTRVCISGGTFQNALLVELTVERLRRCGFEVFLHARVPANDGGLSLGQAAVAARRVGP